jgi:hypothetical protein
MILLKSHPKILTIFLMVFLISCANRSEKVYDKSSGMNGGFEIVNSGLPVNWLVYTSSTVPDGDFDIILDNKDYKDGSQSLKFLIRNCSNVGGWYSPGIASEYHSTPGSTYNITFWIKNFECKFVIKAGGATAFDSKMETIIKTNRKIDTWEKIEYQYEMPSDENYDRFRFELSILSKGSFWIDDINITSVDGKLLEPTEG